MSGNEDTASENAVIQRAKDFWSNSESTFLASSDYYERVESTLNEDILPQIARVGRILDVGCGNGRFTFGLASVAESVLATDLSPKLIEAARLEAKSRNLNNIEFETSDLLSENSYEESFDLVSCMGVLSTLVSDSHMEALLSNLVKCVKPNGYLLLRESLSEIETQRIHEATPPAVYRSTHAYAKRLAKNGLKPVVSARLKSWPKTKRVNYLFLLRKPQIPLLNVGFRFNSNSIFENALDRLS